MYNLPVRGTSFKNKHQYTKQKTWSAECWQVRQCAGKNHSVFFGKKAVALALMSASRTSGPTKIVSVSWKPNVDSYFLLLSRTSIRVEKQHRHWKGCDSSAKHQARHCDSPYVSTSFWRGICGPGCRWCESDHGMDAGLARRIASPASMPWSLSHHLQPGPHIPLQKLVETYDNHDGPITGAIIDIQHIEPWQLVGGPSKQLWQGVLFHHLSWLCLWSTSLKVSMLASRTMGSESPDLEWQDITGRKQLVWRNKDSLNCMKTKCWFLLPAPISGFKFGLLSSSPSTFGASTSMSGPPVCMNCPPAAPCTSIAHPSHWGSLPKHPTHDLSSWME